MLTVAQTKTRYEWPSEPLGTELGWYADAEGSALCREMPEDTTQVALDSRWPSFFSSPICLVSTGDGDSTALEEVVGASVVNCFPCIVAPSFCIEDLSDRHCARRAFCATLEATGAAAVQFIAPGLELDRAMQAIARVPDAETRDRIADSGLPTRRAITSDSPVFDDAYPVYEASLVDPVVDFEGHQLFDRPWTDVGSHRVYYLKISTIQLREDVASGRSQTKWRSLPAFEPRGRIGTGRGPSPLAKAGYTKGYNPNYSFPSKGTIAFAADYVKDGMAVKGVKGVKDSLITDNDDARWPGFFPQSAGMITSRSVGGIDNVMPCGSTTVVSRHPVVIAPAIDAIRCSGNLSLRDDAKKIHNSGLIIELGDRVPVLRDSPIFCECKVTGHRRLDTHVIIFDEVQRIRVRSDVNPLNPLKCCLWADVEPVDALQ